MNLKQIGEFGLIDQIRRAAPQGRGVWFGIGDDAAWVDIPSSSCLVTADLLLEGVHFNLNWTSLFDLGYKSLAVNLSDIAAMGGVPTYVILSLGIPANYRTERVDEFYRGIHNLARKNGVSLVGGDISVAGSLIISVCLLGHAPYRPIARHGAKVGDDIYVTGTLGDAALALELLRCNSPALRRPAAAFLLKRHHQPTPRCRAGLLLARHKLAAAMIDVSDGLLQDLGHICSASGIGAVIWEQSLPLSRSYHTLAGEGSSRWALAGGEDYELLFCTRRRRRMEVQRLMKQAGVPMTLIGECVSQRQGITVLDHTGKKVTPPFKGHDHFSQANTRRFKK
jgi:thiamine-monophosphate kinase